MSLTIIITLAIIISLGFHFVGVYTNSKKIVWTMLIFMWSISIGTAIHEIKPAGYEDVKKMQGKYSDTDKLIKDAMPEISLYELIVIKKSYLNNSQD